MGTSKQSELRRAENEVVFKEHNERIQERVLSIIPEDSKAVFLIHFVCECSDELCRADIELTVDQFEAHTKKARYFITKLGHDQPDIEVVIERYSEYQLVEKFEVPPTTDGVLNRTEIRN
jgi:hypothetical protein